MEPGRLCCVYGRERRGGVGTRVMLRAQIGLPALLICALVALATVPAQAVAGPCPNEALRKESNLNLNKEPFSTLLPDCRAYELVSPPYKDGSRIGTVRAVTEDRLFVGSLGGFASTENNGFNGNLSGGAPYELVRSGSGWVASALSPNPARFPDQQIESLASKDLTRFVWRLREPSESIYAEDLYVREPDGTFVKVGPLTPPSVTGPTAGNSDVEAKGGGAGIRVIGVSSDLSHMLINDPSPTSGTEQKFLWPGDTTATGGEARPSLYEYVGTGNSRPDLVGVSDASTVVNSGVEPKKVLPAGSLIGDCGTNLGGPNAASSGSAVSGDGETVFFTVEPGTGKPCSEADPTVSELYARIHGSETVAISEPTQAQCEKCKTAPAVTDMGATFQGASEDGSKAFFTTEQELLGTEGPALYEYDFDNVTGNKIIPVAGGVKRPEAQGVVRVSRDGSHVYFVAGGVLVTTGTATTASGSKTLENVVTATGEGTLSAATGTGTTTSGSKSVTGVTTSTGAFANGQTISGTGIAAATGTGELTEGSKTVESVVTSTGAFAVGEAISGAGIPANTTISALGAGTITLSNLATTTSTGVTLTASTTIQSIGAGTLTLSVNATASGAGVALTAGSKILKSIVTSTGAFTVGQEISGTGIAVKATITRVAKGELELSAPVTAFGTGVSLSAGSQPFAVGETVAGAGIPSGTTIEAVNGQILTLSADATTAASGVTVTAANREGNAPTAGAENLYVFERDGTYPQGHIAFVATLCSGFEESGSVFDPLCHQNDSGDWESPANNNVQGSPDGRFLVFRSGGDITPGDTSFTKQVFEYDALKEELVRVSDNDGGTEIEQDEAELPPGLALSDDGAYVFFQSVDGLSPGALNNEVINKDEEVEAYAKNVYEYHSMVAAGGSIADGGVSLISDGQDRTLAASLESGTEVFGTDASGGDVFFGSGDRLVGQDTDTQLALYDARVDGGFPAPVSPAGCEGEGCLPAVSAAPLFGSPGSVAAKGGGNLTPPPVVSPPVLETKAKVKAKAKGCKKGFTKKHDKCIKNKSKKKAKKAGNKRGAKL
jgi:hypothetical protein